MEGKGIFGFDKTIKVACMICHNTFPVNEGMVDPENRRW